MQRSTMPDIYKIQFEDGLYQSSNKFQLLKTKTGYVLAMAITEGGYTSEDVFIPESEVSSYEKIELSTYLGMKPRSNQEIFLETYDRCLRTAIESRPELYLFARDEGFDSINFARAMAKAISEGNANLEGLAVRKAIKELGLQCRQGAMQRWINKIPDHIVLSKIEALSSEMLADRTLDERVTVVIAAFKDSKFKLLLHAEGL